MLFSSNGAACCSRGTIIEVVIGLLVLDLPLALAGPELLDRVPEDLPGMVEQYLTVCSFSSGPL